MAKPRKHPSWIHCNSGLTLIEIIFALLILGLISLVIYEFISQSYKLEDYISNQSQAISEAQQGVNTLIKELREADYADDGAYIIENADMQELIFYSDIDIDTYTEKVHYFLEGGQLKKGVIEPTGFPLEYLDVNESVSTISSSVVNATDDYVFTYYDENYPAATDALPYPADATDISLVRINLQINVKPHQIPDTYSLQSVMQLRNLKQNL